MFKAALFFAATLLLVNAWLVHGRSIEAKCTACKAISFELQLRIENERPRNHVDLRHRLNSEGKREGKVIDYKVSELRAVELLDNLCKQMSSYTLITVNGTDGTRTKHWAKFKGQGAVQLEASARPPKHEEEAHIKRLEVYCGSVLEEFEDDLAAEIMKGTFEEGKVSTYLCDQLLKSCPVKAKVPAGDFNKDSLDDKEL